MSTPDARLVPMTAEQRRAIGSLEDFWSTLVPDTDWRLPHVEALRRAWDDAPADPTEAVKAALAGQANGNAELLERINLGDGERYDVDEFDDEAAAVLAALGCSPHPRNEDTDA